MNKLDNIHKLTSISLSKENYEKLKKLGFAGESFNDVLSRVLEKEQVKTNRTLRSNSNNQQNKNSL